MNKFKEHIATKTFTILLACLLLVPASAKFAHIFSDHKHDICKGEISTHLHEINIDCDLYKFKLNTNYTITFCNVELYFPKEISLKINSQYHFLSKFQKLQTSLRGPPVLI